MSSAINRTKHSSRKRMAQRNTFFDRSPSSLYGGKVGLAALEGYDKVADRPWASSLTKYFMRKAGEIGDFVKWLWAKAMGKA